MTHKHSTKRTCIIAAALAAAACIAACKGGLGDSCDWHDDCGSKYVCHKTDAELIDNSPGRCVDGLEQAQDALAAVSEIKKRCVALKAETQEIIEAAKKSKGPRKLSKIRGNPDADPKFIYESMSENRVFEYTRTTCDLSGINGTGCNSDKLEMMQVLIEGMIDGETFNHKVMIGKGL